MKKIFAKIGTLPVLQVMHLRGRLAPGEFVEVRRLKERNTVIHCKVEEKVESPSGTTHHWVLSRM